MNSSKLQDRKVWIGGGGVLVLLIAVASWLLLIHPKLSDASDMRSQTADTNLQNAQLENTNTVLARKYAHLADLRTSLTQVTDAVPPVNGFPELTREINLVATDTGATIKTITVGAPTAVVATAGTTSVAGSTASGSTSNTAASTAASSTAASAGSSAATSQYQSAVSITVDGTAVQTVEFVDALQHGPRDILVGSTQMTVKGKAVEMTIQADVFTVPMTTEQLAQLKKLLSASN